VATTAQRETAPVPPPDVVVEYCGDATALLHRAVSGRLYTFSSARRARRVSPRDAALLLLDQDFRLLQQ
jgi:hypothetical protein